MNKTNLKVKAQSSKFWDLGFGIWDFRASRGYTLIEMLISVTIFSGLLIIVLGTVASSSGSSAKVSVLREKSQAARSLIDQISNDLRYADTSAEFKEGTTHYRGYAIESSRNRLVIALKLPNADPNKPLVRKDYEIQTISNRLTITLKEGRKCLITAPTATPALALECDQNSTGSIDLLSSAYELNQVATTFPSELSGLNVIEAEQSTPPISPFVSMVFTLKPVRFTTSCSLDPGTCYKVSTTVNMGTNR